MRLHYIKINTFKEFYLSLNRLGFLKLTTSTKMVPFRDKSIVVLFILLRYTSSQQYACRQLAAYPLASISRDCYRNPDILSDVQAMVIRHGHKIEIHSLTTTDGYILSLFRILSKERNITRPPVFIQHGILTSSAPFTATSNRSLAFNLADLGYDVWLGNFRGSTYSQEHVTLKIDDGKFWEFNLDDLAKYDIKEQLQYIARNTGKGGTIIYLGHNMGTILGFLFASEFPEEAKNLIQGIVALGPIIYNKGSLHFTYACPLIELVYALRFKGVAYQETFVHTSLVRLCKVSPIACHWFLLFFYGPSKQLEPDDIPLFFSYWPSGTSVALAHQYCQIFYSDQLKKYDFGKKGNIERYGTETPPFYDLRKVKVPVYLFYGKNDILYTQKNIDRLYSEVGSSVKHKQPVPRHNDTYAFDNINFQYAKYIKGSLYEDLFSILENNF